MTKKYKFSYLKFLSGICVSVLLAGHTTAYAQSIDYNSLEALFGEPVTTSATGQPQRVSEAPITMEIITADDIRRSGATSVPEVLRNESSMSVWNWTRSTHDVNVRGYNQNFSPRLLVLVNGRQVYSDSYGNTLWENLPVQLNEIRQIEIVEGPNSALYGFNAVSGVINIITYNPMYDDVSNVAIQTGTNGYKKGQAIYSHKFGENLAMRFSGGATELNEFSNNSSTPFYDPAQHEMSLDSVLKINNNSEIRFESSQTKAKTTEYAVVYSPFNTKYFTRSNKINYLNNSSLGIIEANVYKNWQTTSSSGFGIFPKYKNEVLVTQLSDLLKINTDHTVKFQTEYRHNTLNGNLVSENGAEIFYDVFAGSAMWNWKLNNNISLTNAARIDHLDIGRRGDLITNPILLSNDDFDKKTNEFSYNSGLVWTIDPHNIARLSIARGIQAPSLLDLGIGFNLGPIITLGNPLLKSSIVNNYEFGLDHKIDFIDGNFISNIFYQRTKDIKSSAALNTPSTQQGDNIGDSNLIGMKVGLEGKFRENWSWDAQYSIQKATDHLSLNQSAITSPYNGDDATPKHTATAHLGYADGPWEADAYAQYVSKYKVLLNAGATYNSIDAGNSINVSGRVGYKLPNDVTLALSGTELNHSDAVETSGPKVERQVFLSLTKEF